MLKTDILKSYSKFHNRKLLLLEQEEDNSSKVGEAIARLNNPDSKWEVLGSRTAKDGTLQTNYAAIINGKEYTYLSHNGTLITHNNRFTARGPAGLNPTEGGDWLPSLDVKSSQEAFDQFIGSLVGDEEIVKSEGQKKKEEALRAGSVLDNAEDTALNQQEKDAVRFNLEAIVANLPNVWDKMEQDQTDAYGSLEKYQAKFTGMASDSFESKLLADKNVLFLENGEWVSNDRRPDGPQSIGVSKSLSDLVQLVSNDDPSDEQCSDITNDFAIHVGTRDSIIISPRGDGGDRTAALSFTDPQQTLRNLLVKAAAKCNKPVRSVNVRAKSSGGKNDNAIRGFAFEEILEAFSLAMLKRGRKGEETPASKALDTILVQKTSSIIQRLQRLKLSTEEWVEAVKYSGLDPSQKQLIQDISDIANGMGETLSDFNPNNLFGSMMAHSRTALQGRKPTYILPVGTETKRGQRQDVLEVYKTREEAVAAAKRVGVDIEPEEYDSLDTALRGAQGIVKEEGGSVSMAELLENANVFTPGQKVYTLKVSLKNYKKFEGHGASMGGGRKNTLPSITEVEGTEFKSDFMKTIQDVAGIDNPRQFKKYFDSVARIESSVMGLGTGRYTKSRGPGKGTVQVDNLKNLEKLLASTLKNQGLDLLPHAREISSLLKKMTEQKSYSDLESDATYRKAQQTVIRYLEDTKLYTDIRNGDTLNNPNPRQIRKRKQALQYLATRMMHAGGSDDDQTLCDYRGLNKSKDYVFKQNDPIREAWSSILKDDGEWSLVTGEEEGDFNGGFRLTKKGTKAGINFEYSLEGKKDKGRVVDFFGQFETRINKEALEYFNKLQKQKNESKVDEAFRHIMLALSLLQEKVSIAEGQ